MKKLLCFVCLVSFSSVAFSQVKVSTNGNVGIKNDGTPLSTLSVNSNGDNNYEMVIESNKIGVHFVRSGTVTGNWGISLSGDALPASSTYNVGLLGYAVSQALMNGRAYGIMGRAGNCSSGYNYGVYGKLEGTAYGAGIYGTSSAIDNGSSVPGRYAGYFNGNMYVTGSIYGRILTPSATLQQNLSSLSRSVTDEGVISKIAQLNVVEYNLVNPASQNTALAKNANDTLSVSALELSAEESQAYAKNHYGFIAQELKKVYPDLVYENAQGELSINYIEMIPLLVQSIQELTSEINTLKTDQTEWKAAPTTRSGNENFSNLSDLSDCILPELFQNIPNPFTVDTEIRYRIPKEAQVAALYIYDMNGKQVDEFPLTQKGGGTVTLQGSRLEAGMYLYSLIIDGKLIDVKRMILTK